MLEIDIGSGGISAKRKLSKIDGSLNRRSLTHYKLLTVGTRRSSALGEQDLPKFDNWSYSTLAIQEISLIGTKSCNTLEEQTIVKGI